MITDPAELRRSIAARRRDEAGDEPYRCEACGTHYGVAVVRGVPLCPDHSEEETMTEAVRTGTMNIATGKVTMEDGKPPATGKPAPTPVEQVQAGADAFLVAHAAQQAPARREAKPDPKPGSTKTTVKPKTTTTAKPATTKQDGAKTPAQPAGGAKAAEQRAAKSAAAKRAKSVAALLSAGKIERNQITQDVAKHGDLKRAAKDAGVTVTRVEAAIRPASSGPAKSGGTRTSDATVDLVVAYVQGTGSPAERFAATGRNAAARRALWAAGMRPGFDKQPDAKLRDAIRAAVAAKLGKTWAAIEKSTPVPNRKASK